MHIVSHRGSSLSSPRHLIHACAPVRCVVVVLFTRLLFLFVPLLFFRTFQMSSSEFHERLKSKDLRDFRLGTVASSDHETLAFGGACRGRVQDLRCPRQTWDGSDAAGGRPLTVLEMHVVGSIDGIRVCFLLDFVSFSHRCAPHLSTRFGGTGLLMPCQDRRSSDVLGMRGCAFRLSRERVCQLRSTTTTATLRLRSIHDPSTFHPRRPRQLPSRLRPHARAATWFAPAIGVAQATNFIQYALRTAHSSRVQHCTATEHFVVGQRPKHSFDSDQAPVIFACLQTECRPQCSHTCHKILDQVPRHAHEHGHDERRPQEPAHFSQRVGSFARLAEQSPLNTKEAARSHRARMRTQAVLNAKPHASCPSRQRRGGRS